MNISRATHPTAHEVLVGDRVVPVQDNGTPICPMTFVGRILASVRTRLDVMAARRRAVRALGIMFDAERDRIELCRADAVLDAGTTLVELEIVGPGGPCDLSIHLVFAGGMQAELNVYGFRGYDTYAVRYLTDRGWLCTSEYLARDLARETGPGTGLTAALAAA